MLVLATATVRGIHDSSVDESIVVMTSSSSAVQIGITIVYLCSVEHRRVGPGAQVSLVASVNLPLQGSDNIRHLILTLNHPSREALTSINGFSTIPRLPDSYSEIMEEHDTRAQE